MRRILRVLMMLLMCQMIKSVPVCKPNQMMRKDISGNSICCYTLICRQGQTFAFCEHDQSIDTCSNCPEGTYHLDTIDTSKMNTELDPCISKPTCEQPEVRLENGKCICDRSRGYYGNDIYNCMLAEMMCTSPGFELKENGKCEPCAEGFFKPETSAENNCRLKSSCHESQDIANNGSTTIDRSCKAKIKINLPAIKLTTENNIDNSDKNNNQSSNEQQNNDVVIGIIIGIGVVVIIVCIVTAKVIRRDKPLHICLCIQTWSTNCHTYEKASKDDDNNKTYNEVYTLSNRSISHTYEETCVLMSGITDNNDDTSHYDNTSAKEKNVSISKEEIRKPHMAEVHSSSGAESFSECSTDKSPSAAHEGCIELISDVNPNSPCKQIWVERAKKSPQKLKSISQILHEKSIITDKHKTIAEFSNKKTLASSDNEQNGLQSKQNLIRPYDVSSNNKSAEMTIEVEHVCRQKTYKKSNVEDAKSRSKRKIADNAGKSDKKEHSKYENMPRKNAKTRTRQLENTIGVFQLKNTQIKTLSKMDKTTQSRVDDPLNILEDESIADPYTQKRTDFLRHVHEEVVINNVDQPNQEEDISSKSDLKNKQLPMTDKNPTTNIIPSVATVKPRLRRKEKDPNNQWTTQEHHLAVTQPDNQDIFRKVATSRAPRPSESEMSNNVHSGSSSETSQEENSNDAESFDNSGSSTFDPGEETALKYLPPVDSVEF
ncbi:Hypothetical predicted protein [Mytilus galloprovincialis]|uniref:TNFR-Cys domain-containing protein n=1 Tax=Mytilus galloprovincialis TaxID=29158 RepID=A0A8B6F4S3_MYTGA|nr:Hypothetical predicted protein [Mytilus galloprovincialis]